MLGASMRRVGDSKCSVKCVAGSKLGLPIVVLLSVLWACSYRSVCYVMSVSLQQCHAKLLSGLHSKTMCCSSVAGFRASA